MVDGLINSIQLSNGGPIKIIESKLFKISYTRSVSSSFLKCARVDSFHQLWYLIESTIGKSTDYVELKKNKKYEMYLIAYSVLNVILMVL